MNKDEEADQPEEVKKAEEHVLSKEISRAIDDRKFVIGLKESMRALKTGNAKMIVYAKNIPEKLKKEIVHYSGIAKVHAEMFDGSSTGLGVVCKRAHGVLVSAITKHESK